MAETNQQYDTILGPDASFKGDLSFNAAAKLLGKFEGSISAQGKVLIAKGATCKATVNAKEIAVEGRVEGNVVASEHVQLKQTGIITGDITATRMSMADGATIDGHCRIGTNGQASGKSSASVEVKSTDAADKSAKPAQATATAKK